MKTAAPVPAKALAIPRATYRLQLSGAFTFADAEAVIPYLASLGISHVYCSSFLKARPGSNHGYDITDHNALNPEIGSMEMLDGFCRTLAAHGMGLILDFVPNHMGIGQADNAWWLDVLEQGQNSLYADFFDIDWQPPLRALRGKVLLPFLGDHYGTVLERGELTLKFDPGAGSFSVWYHEHRFPVRPRSYAGIIRRQLASEILDEADKARLQSLAADFDRLRRVGRRQRAAQRKDAEALKRMLADLGAANPAIGQFLTQAAAAFNGVPGDPDSFRPLHNLLERQFYRLAYWRVAADEINYRRFFNINDLVGIRIENPVLFETVHRFVGQLIAAGKLHGLRLDHIDGLFDPEAYCCRLRDFVTRSRAAAPGGGGEIAPFYVVVEKILARHEKLRTDWPVAGTTGYDFANLVNGLFVDPSGRRALERIYRSVAGRPQAFDAIMVAAKDDVIDNMLSSELNVLAREIDRIGNQDWVTRDYTEGRLRRALKSVVAHFPVYRTYVTAKGASAADRRDIDWAVSQAAHAWTGPDSETLTFVRDALTGDLAGRKGRFRRAEVMRFARRFQQYTSPVAAKAVEDTSFYRYNLLISLNEVGGDPRQFGTSAAAFHEANRQRARQWPAAMLATSTHDTKRGEDARVRIDILSEIPEEWDRRVRRWMSLNRFLRRQVDGDRAPSRNDEYMIYQALVGAWPAAFAGRPAADSPELADFSERMQAFAIKAAREAKLVTSWADPKPPYEEAYTAFLGRLLDASRPNPFLDDFAEFHAAIAYPAMLASLSQLLMKLTVPGVPDIYQGADLWDLSLVDPDNRRPVDFRLRQDLLQAITGGEGGGPDLRAGRLSQMLADWRDGRIKLCLTRALLNLRAADPELFGSGGYEPLQSHGRAADHVIAFIRRHGDRRLLVVAGRLFAQLTKMTGQAYDAAAVWGDTAVEAESDSAAEWTNLLTKECIRPILRGERAVLPCVDALNVLPVGVFLSRAG